MGEVDEVVEGFRGRDEMLGDRFLTSGASVFCRGGSSLERFGDFDALAVPGFHHIPARLIGVDGSLGSSGESEGELTPDLVVLGDVAATGCPDHPVRVLAELPGIIHRGILRKGGEPDSRILARFLSLVVEPVVDLHGLSFLV